MTFIKIATSSLLFVFVSVCQAAQPLKIVIAHKVFSVEIASTPDELTKGLMYRNTMPQNHGMLFVFPDEKPRAFWMKNTLLFLDMVFIDTNSVIVHIEHNAQPCENNPCRNYDSPPARYVLEVNASQSSPAKVGDTITLPQKRY